MNNPVRNIRYAVIVMLVAVFPLEALAQWNFDIVSVEAYINDHKQQRSLLLARSTLELSNQLLHEYSSEAAVGYKELNIDLDKYTRAFDVIDILYQSLRTSLNVYSTYNTVSDRVAVCGKNRRGRQATLPIDERLGAVCYWCGGLLHLGLAAGIGKHQPRSGQHRTAFEQSLLRDLAVHPASHGVLERKHLHRQEQVADCERGVPAVAGFGSEPVQPMTGEGDTNTRNKE